MTIVIVVIPQLVQEQFRIQLDGSHNIHLSSFSTSSNQMEDRPITHPIDEARFQAIYRAVKEVVDTLSPMKAEKTESSQEADRVRFYAMHIVTQIDEQLVSVGDRRIDITDDSIPYNHLLLDIGDIVPEVRYTIQNMRRQYRPDESDGAVPFVLDWLSKLDHGQYDLAWRDTDEDFATDYTAEEWAATIGIVRKYSAKADTRRVVGARATSALTGYKYPGRFMHVEVETESEDGESWHELVVLVRRDDTWRVIGHTPWTE